MFTKIKAIFAGVKVSKYFFIGLGLAIVFGIAIFTIKHLTDTVVEEARDKGRSEIIIETQEKGIKDVQAAQKAREELNNNPSARRIECLRNNRRPENCPSE